MGISRTFMKNIMLVIFYILVILVIIGCLYYYFIYTNKKGYHDNNKIKLHNWWNLNDDEHYNTVTFFNDTMTVDTLKKYKEIHIFSVFGKPEFVKNPENLYIQYSGESYYSDPSMFDINLIPDEKYEKAMTNKRDAAKTTTVLFPHGYFTILSSNMNMNYFLQRRTLQIPKTRFCLFCVSNGSNWVRNDFFEKLSKYKQVDSCGSFMNNMPNNERCPQDPAEYMEYISQYKFMICFENKPQRNYLTEKLFNSYYAETIPIYWGCTNVSDYINMDSILYLKTEHSEKDMENLIEDIILLDNDDEEYQRRYNCELFRGGVLPDEFNLEAIKVKINQLALHNATTTVS